MGQSCVAGECVLDPCTELSALLGKFARSMMLAMLSALVDGRPHNVPSGTRIKMMMSTMPAESIDISDPFGGGMANVDDTPSGGNAIAGNGLAAETTEEPDAVAAPAMQTHTTAAPRHSGCSL